MRENTYGRQDIKRLEHMASTSNGDARIGIIIINDETVEVALNGTPKDSFLDLRNEVRERLQEGGYDVRFIDLNF